MALFELGALLFMLRLGGSDALIDCLFLRFEYPGQGRKEFQRRSNHPYQRSQQRSNPGAKPIGERPQQRSHRDDQNRSCKGERPNPRVF